MREFERQIPAYRLLGRAIFIQEIFYKKRAKINLAKLGYSQIAHFKVQII
jgi:hypothetical protein